MRVLIAEDDPLGGMVLERALRQAGHEVHRAEDGLAALASALALPFDAVLVDLVMPKMDGHQLMRALREHLDPTPILIVTTAITSDESKDRALESGADEYLTKPFDPRRVVEVLRECAQRRTQTPSQVLPAAPASVPSPAPFPCVVLVAGSGGPTALRQLLSRVNSADFALIVVQHAPAWLLEQLLRMLQRACPLPVQLAADGDLLKPGCVYLAPADRHLLVDDSRTVRLVDDPPENLMRPSADPLFRSAARVFGSRCVAVVLGGMGCDGASGAAQVAQLGGQVLIQDPHEADAPAMPKAPLSLGIKANSIRLNEMADALGRYTRPQN